MVSEPKLNFENTENAFSHKSKKDLKKAYWLFYTMKFAWLTKMGTWFINFSFAINLPIKGIIKRTLFNHFCGGENINDCEETIQDLYKGKIGTILDYSVEGEKSENVFISTKDEIIRTIKKSASSQEVPFSVFKITGVAPSELLQKVQENKVLSELEDKQFQDVKNRVNEICKAAYEHKVRLLVDAEETWIQDTIDELVEEMMSQYNKEHFVIHNTIQFYRKNGVDLLKKQHEKSIVEQYKYGIKMVRGAYMEQERARAIELNYSSPINDTKQDSDDCFDEGLAYCIKNRATISLVAGTHNEKSSALLASQMDVKNDEKIYFAQLYGMSDHISYTLSKAGYNVAKYVPYGPVKSVMPYLFRRAEENTSIAGQTGRELSLIEKELDRRKG